MDLPVLRGLLSDGILSPVVWDDHFLGAGHNFI